MRSSSYLLHPLIQQRWRAKGVSFKEGALRRLLEGSLQTEYVLDGKRFNTLEEFLTEVGRVFVGGEP